MPLPGAYRHPFRIANSVGLGMNYSGIRHQAWVDEPAIDDNGWFEIVTMAATATTTTYTPDGAYVAAPASPRNVIVTITHASSVIVVSGVITGTDFYDRVITAAWSVTATGTSKTSVTAKAFKTVTSITAVTTVDSSGNSIIVGSGDVLGLDAPCVHTAPVIELEDGAAPTAGVLVAGVASSATADALGTYDPNSALNGALDFDIWYIVDYPHYIGANAPAVA